MKREPDPHRVKLKATCPACGKDRWFKRPSGVIVCATCGSVYEPPTPAQLRP